MLIKCIFHKYKYHKWLSQLGFNDKKCEKNTSISENLIFEKLIKLGIFETGLNFRKAKCFQ